MATTYRLGVAGLSHDHVWGELAHWKKQGNVQIVAGGDDEPELLEKLRKETGIERTYDSALALLEREELELLQIAGANSEAAELVEAAAERGIHCIVEKPMAATLAQADRMLAAAQTFGTQLLINWPTAWSAGVQEMERQILAGAIGELRYFRYRSAHSGPVAIGCSPSFVRDLTDPERNGAGALMDYCCYAADMCARFLGLPRAVTGMRGVFGDEPAYRASDDNAIIVLRYPHAFGVAEASWTQPVGYAGTNPVAYGADGSVGLWHGKVLLQRAGEEQREIEPPPTEAPYRSAPEYLLHCLESGQRVEGFCSAAVSRDAQEILEAGLRSAESGRTETLPLSESG